VAAAGDFDALAMLARHAEAIATVRAFADRSGAERVVLLVDRGEEAAVMVDRVADGTVEVTDAGVAVAVPPEAAVPAAARALPEIRAAPPSALQGDPDTGELIAPIGVVSHLGESVLALARAFGGRSVASADFATRDPELPITVVARDGEPLLLAMGDGRFELPLP
jgi:hypothetical protein